MNRLSLRVEGERISMDTLAQAMTTFVGLLGLVDESVHGERLIHWRLAGLSYSSTPATIASQGEPTRRAFKEDPTPRVVSVLLDGFEGLESHSVVHPSFTDDILDGARQLSVLRGRGGITGLSLHGANGTEPPKSVGVTQRIAATVDDVLGAKYRAFGSVEGRLEAINIHRSTFFNIYEPVHGRRVRCRFGPEQLEKAKADLGYRVIVAGEVLSNARGHPTTINVKSFERLPGSDELPSVGEISGIAPGFTGGLESSRYVRERWDGEQG